MDLNINPFSLGNPMTLKDAAIVATVVAFVTWVLSFFANAQWIIITANPAAWCFEALKSYFVYWAGSFVTLAGLEQLVKQKE